MAGTKKTIESKAREVLIETDCLRVPVPVDLVSTRIGVGVEPTTLGDHVSGLLVVQGSGGLIGYNRSHVPVHQRFTIAHEIGHYVLHRKSGDLFIDRHHKVFARDKFSSRGEDEKEVEANAFAAALLMPEELVEEELDRIGFDLGDEADVRELANKFNVSTQSMLFRLTNLGVFK